MARPLTKLNVDRAILRGAGYSLWLFGLSRLLLMAVIWTGTQIFPKNTRHVFLSWDPYWWHMAIAQGYPHVATQGEAGQNTIAFFPLYPLLARFVSWFGATPLQAGVIVSLIFGAIATVLLWLLAFRLTDERIANRSVALFCFFPSSLTLLLLTSEGLMLALSLACLLALLNKRWLVAGLLAALATATRPNAVVLVLCCLWLAAIAIKRDRDWRALIAPILAPCGTLAYFLFLWHHTGDFLAWTHVERAGWKNGAFTPFASFSSLLHPFDYFDNAAAACALVVAIAGLYFVAKWKPPAVIFIFCAGLCLLAFENGGTESKLRYVWTAAPLFIAAARWARTEIRFVSLLSSFAVSTVLYTYLTVFTLRVVL